MLCLNCIILRPLFVCNLRNVDHLVTYVCACMELQEGKLCGQLKLQADMEQAPKHLWI